jgi:hypothetical protein
MSMHASDKAALRLTVGLGLAVLIAYGGGLPVPYMVCLLSAMLLCRPGPPLPLIKGLVLASILAVLVAVGVLMVPVLEHYAVSGILLTAAALFALFYVGLRQANPLAPVLVIVFSVVPVVGVMEQALVGMVSVAIASSVAIGVVVSVVSHGFFPDAAQPRATADSAPPHDAETAAWIALRATLIVMPVFLLALTDPSFYLAAVMKSVGLGQQAGETDARSAGSELVGSTLMGAAMALLLWFGLSLWPSLWMLALWVMAAGLYAGARIFGARRSRFSASFWSNALATALILLGPAIADSASGKGVFEGSATRVSLYLGLAIYAWATVRLIENRRTARRRTLSPDSRPSGG